MVRFPQALDGVTIPARFTRRATVTAGVIEQLRSPATTVSGEYSVAGHGTDLQGAPELSADQVLHFVSAEPVDQEELREYLFAPRSRTLDPAKLFAEGPPLS